MSKMRFAYQKMCKNIDGGWEAMAAMLGKTVNSLESKIYERGGQRMDVFTALQMQKASKTTFFAEAIAAESGGVFVKTPEIDCHLVDIPILYMRLIEEVGELSKEWHAAISDGKLSEREKNKLEFIRQRICQDVTLIHIMTLKIFSDSKN